MDEKDKRFSFKMKIIISLLMFFIAVYLVILSCVSVSASNLTLINDDMNTDEILQAIGKNPDDYTDFDKSIEDLLKLSDSDYATYLSTFTNCYDFVGVGEGVDTADSSYASTYLIFKSKLSYGGQAYYENIGYCNLWCGKLDGNDVLDSNVYRYVIDFLNQKDLTDKGDYYETGLSGCIVSEETRSKGILVYKVRCYSKDVLNNSHRICLENIRMQNGPYYYLSFVQDYILNDDGSFEVDNNMIPKYVYCEKYDGKIMFEFEHASNVKLQAIKLDNTYYDVKLYSYDGLMSRGYYTLDFDIEAYGTKTYSIKGYKFNDNCVELDNPILFRYVSTKTIVWVEAKIFEYKTDDNGFYYGFSFINKSNGEKISNVKSVKAVFTQVFKNIFKKDEYIDRVQELDVSNGIPFIAVYTRENCSELTTDKKYIDKYFKGLPVEYVWVVRCADDVLNFDDIYIKYEVDNKIINGSCYENGLHVEIDSKGNKAVYDMDGVKHDEYSVDDNDLIIDKDGKPLDTTNPDPSDVTPKNPSLWDKIKKLLGIDVDDSIITKIKKFISIFICVFAFLVVFWFLKALGLTQYIGKFIVWLFKIITYPVRWIINKLRD